MSYVYGADVLPAGKVDAHPLVGPPSKNVTAAEWNAVMAAIDAPSRMSRIAASAMLDFLRIVGRRML